MTFIFEQLLSHQFKERRQLETEQSPRRHMTSHPSRDHRGRRGCMGVKTEERGGAGTGEHVDDTTALFEKTGHGYPILEPQLPDYRIDRQNIPRMRWDTGGASPDTPSTNTPPRYDQVQGWLVLCRDDAHRG